MSGLSITLDKKVIAEVSNFVKLFPNAADTIARRTALSGLKLIVMATPVKVGVTRRAWRTVRAVDGIWRIVADKGSGQFIMPMLETGTGLFGPKKRLIKPKNGKKCLAFTITPKGSNTKLVANPAAKGDKKYIFFRKSSKGFKGYWMVQSNIKNIQTNMTKIGKKVVSDLFKQSTEAPLRGDS